jgi:hypothetical protein
MGARLADTMMHLAFVLSRRWMPYRKWRGTAFRTLPVAAELTGPLTEAATAPTWRQREDAIATAAGVLAARQRSRGLPAPDPATVQFFDRPYRTVPGAMMADLRAGDHRP